MTKLTSDMDRIYEKVRELRSEKIKLKEDFYGRMCDYEIQQAYIKDVEWITQTKQIVFEREERNAQIQAERLERLEQRRLANEARKKREAEVMAQQEARKAE